MSWNQRRPSVSYKQELQKLFAANYNRGGGANPNAAENEIVHTEYVSNSLSPIIEVRSVTFNTEEDGKKHKTHLFELMKRTRPVPVYRRGQPFSINIHFSRSYNPKEDFFILQAEYGPKPSEANGTINKISLSSKEPENDTYWDMWTTERDESVVTIQVQTPIKCQVGMWKLRLFTSKANSSGTLEFNFPEEIYILFNPWNKNDTVYLENENEREEYVLNDHGVIYTGVNKEPTADPWVFGQFGLSILPVLTLLLEQSTLQHYQRGSPVLVARALSALVNHYDDNGLMEGKWQEVGEDMKHTFDGGVKPTDWTGSVAIYDQYLQTGRSVKYAQCWVFSGVLTTACRALGIPCRPVTCFKCAHDSDNSLTVDRWWTRDGKWIDGGPDGNSNDSIWNFHCFNEVWMKRPDLPQGYNGWQVLDGTPQETSNGKYKTGPAPLHAVKEGNVGYRYDTGFVFAGVNADVCHFKEDDSSPWGFSRIKLDPQVIGERLVTRGLFKNANGERKMEDITHFYKNEEGSEAERLAVFNAVRGNLKAQKYYKAVESPVVRDVFFQLKEIDKVVLGDVFTVSLTVENHSSEERTIKTHLSAYSVFYTGRTHKIIKEGSVKVVLQPKEAKTARITVLPEEYKDAIRSSSHIKIMVIGTVKETKQAFSAEDNFEITTKNKLEIKVPERMKVGYISAVNFLFTNPLVEPLTDCQLTIEGPGLQKPKTVKISDVLPNGHAKHVESIIPKIDGSQVLVATFSCDQLSGIKGFKNVLVQQ